MNVNGSELMRLTRNTATDVYPSWSPDGLKIVFEMERYFDEEVYVMEARL